MFKLCIKSNVIENILIKLIELDTILPGTFVYTIIFFFVVDYRNLTVYHYYFLPLSTIINNFSSLKIFVFNNS